MTRRISLSVFFLAVFLQSGAYGLTFMLPRLFEGFGANEKTVGSMLLLTTVSTLISVYFSGHMSDLFGRLRTLGIACIAIAAALAFFGIASAVGPLLISASLLLGFGWGLTYSLGPVVLTRLVRDTERIQSFALLSVFVMAGFGLAPVFASLLELLGHPLRSAFFMTAALSGISAVLFLALEKPFKTHAINAAPERSSRITLTSLRAIAASKALVPIVMVWLGASVFAGLNNFQTVFAEDRGLNYAAFFFTYTVTVVTLRLILATFKGGNNPYRTIALLQYIMCASIVLFIFSSDSAVLYIAVAILFGLGYGMSYPILVAMAANDAETDLVPQTLQLFALSYFIGVFGYPLIAGWLIVEIGQLSLLISIAILAGIEATLALRRALDR